MAIDRNDNKTADLEDTVHDRAIRAVRDFQKGAATVTFVKIAIKAVPASELDLVALATRVPKAQLEKLRN